MRHVLLKWFLPRWEFIVETFIDVRFAEREKWSIQDNVKIALIIHRPIESESIVNPMRTHYRFNDKF